MAQVVRYVTRLTQRMFLTQRMHQAVMILYRPLPTVELFELLNQEMADNPLLEDAAGEDYDDYGPESEPFDASRVGFEDALEERLSLRDYLTSQLELQTDEDIVRAIGDVIIGNLDSNGYLDASVEDIAALGQWQTADVVRTLQLIQSLNPSGVACRTLCESLRLQLHHLGLGGTAAERIVTEHLPLLAGGCLAEIARAANVSLDEAKTIVAIVRCLDPKPGRRYSVTPVIPLIPDVYVVKQDGWYTAVFNEDGLPDLRINPVYRRLLDPDSHADAETRAYVKERLRSARSVIKCVMAWRKAIDRVATSIVHFERDFFEYGVGHLRPLCLRDVSNDVGMHQSSVGRLIANKYMATPQGLLSMRSFFHRGIPTSYGELMSPVSIRQRIRTLIEGEDPAQPLSDAAIIRLLEKEGLMLSRGAVGKYRRSLTIPGQRERVVMRWRSSRGLR